MTNQKIWIGIAVGVFFVGIAGGIAYASSPTGHQFIMGQIMQNPDFRQIALSKMMNDPQGRQQMMNQMMQNSQMMQDITQNNQMTSRITQGQNMQGQGGMMGSGTSQNMMSSGMQGNGGMMGSGGMMTMTQDPQFQELMTQQRQQHQELMQDFKSSNWNNPDFQTQMQQRFQQHQEFIQELLENNQ